ncbi:MAG: Type II secretion system F domain protein [Parcubacteria group bacterium GW2011_GWF2_39_13b]|nr:MAG: Type II secretion system F domain protein [Parcubacteria group bacterium GW2011_GWF2_39_13b]
MPTFIYKARAQDGGEKSGVIEAVSKSALAMQLHQEGYFLTSVILAGNEKTIGFASRFLNSVRLLAGVSLAEKMIFSRHLAVMIKAGLALPRSLEILSSQTKNKYFKRIINAVKESVSRGQNFSDSLNQYPDVFSEFFISMVKVGEAAGNLDNILVSLASQMEKDHELRSKVRSAMIYPAVITVVMVGIGILMMVTVIPKLSATFIELNLALPWSTQLVMGVSSFLSNNIIISLIIIVFAILLIRLFLNTKAGKHIADRLILNVPPFSTLSRKINSAYFARNLSSLIEAGVPILNALQIVAKTLSNSFFQDSLIWSSSQVQKGDPLSKVLQNFPQLYPAMVAQMIEVGETTGTLSAVLTHLADFYEGEVTDITKNLSSIVEPVLMVLIGIVVGFFAISMIQPMYSLMNQM